MKQLNRAFQKQARIDKELSLQETCQQIEVNNKRGRTRDLFKEVKNITGTFNPKCGSIKASNGKMVTEGKNVKERWKEYTESLYKKDPNIYDMLIEDPYEDEPEVLESEVKVALQQLANGKAVGCDGIPIELLKLGGKEAVKTLTSICNCIWKNKKWPKDWKKSVFVPIFKKGCKKECGNYRTIALISHASKVLLKVILKRLEAFLLPELPDEQAGFKRGRGTRDHIANLRWLLESSREYQQDIFICFIDYKKAFDCVDLERMWITLKDMGVPLHLIILLKNLYANQEATVRTEFGETDKINIGKGVRQGCILSPILFNIYAERVMREALVDYDGGVRIGGLRLTNLRYADDTSLLEGTERHLVQNLENLRAASEKAGLYLHVGKTKLMTTGVIGDVFVNGEKVEVVNNFSFLGAHITNDGLCEKEIRRRIGMGKAAMGRLTKIWKDRGITLRTKVKLVRTLVFPIVLYGAETWTVRKSERKKLDAFEMWCWRRVLRVSWRERRTNEWVINTINPEWTLESRVVKAALSYFGHVARSEGMEKMVMLGKVGGNRRRGRPRTRWLDSIKEVCGPISIRDMIVEAQERTKWRKATVNVARGRVRLDGT